MVKVNVSKLSNSKAFWNTRYQNFFNLGEGKSSKTKQFQGFSERKISKFYQSG